MVEAQGLCPNTTHKVSTFIDNLKALASDGVDSVI